MSFYKWIKWLNANILMLYYYYQKFAIDLIDFRLNIICRSLSNGVENIQNTWHTLKMTFYICKFKKRICLLFFSRFFAVVFFYCFFFFLSLIWNAFVFNRMLNMLNEVQFMKDFENVYFDTCIVVDSIVLQKTYQITSMNISSERDWGFLYFNGMTLRLNITPVIAVMYFFLFCFPNDFLLFVFFFSN